MKRRDFLNWVGVGGLASFLPIVIAACSPQKNTTETTTSAEWQKVGTVGELDKTGQLLLAKSPLGPLLLVGKSQTPQTLIAVDPTCTHKGCTVEWIANTKIFECPCHQAKFTAEGKVKTGPAKESLKTYTAKIQGDSILVKAI